MKSNGSIYANVLAGVLIALSLTACGSGGGGSGADNTNAPIGGGAPQEPATPSEPVDVPGLNAQGDIVDSQAVYNDVSPQPLLNVDITILPPEPGGQCTADDGTGNEDYSGCTLADLDGDEDGDDAFDPFLRVIFSAYDYTPDAGFAYNAEMEVRGSSTRFTDQKSYKVQLIKGQTKWHGQRRLQLNKHPYDLTRIRNKLAFDLFRSVDDFTSLRTQFVHMRVTGPDGTTIPGNDPVIAGPDYGLFTHVEYMDENWAVAHGQVKDSNIFKAEQFEFLSVASTPGLLAEDTGSDEFEQTLSSDGDNQDTGPLLAMLDAVNSDNAFGPVFNRYFHADNFRTWLGINILLSNADTNSQNFFIYRPMQIDNFYFTPWDYDGSLGYINQPGNGANQARWQRGLSNWWNVQIIRRYIQNGGVPALNAKLEQLISGPVNADAISSLVAGYPMAAIDALEQKEPDARRLPLAPNSNVSAAEQRDNEIARLSTIPARSLAQYRDNLNRPMPMFLAANDEDGVLTFEWDPSYDLQGDAIRYDVRVSTNREQALETTRCSRQTSVRTVDSVQLPADPVSLLSGNGVVISMNGVQGTSLAPARELPAGVYYLQVIARDSGGYCQTAFDSYTDDNDNTTNGVLAFYWDGSVVQPVENTP